MSSRLWVYLGLALLGALSILATPLSLFVLVGSFIALLAVPDRSQRRLTWLAGGALVASTVGFIRFIATEALAGMVQGGNAATGQAAVSRLREIVFAEDALRREASIDPDEDGVGSAAFLEELTGRIGLRGGPRLLPARLEHTPAPTDTPIGPAMDMNGYLFVVCLPGADGRLTARPGDAIDEEAAERRFVAYAWPLAGGLGLKQAYFTDEHERILVTDNVDPGGAALRLGPQRPPSCDDALAPGTRAAWRPWRNKKPRTHLPGDPSAGGAGRGAAP
jgi:hypothetical protein